MTNLPVSDGESLSLRFLRIVAWSESRISRPISRGDACEGNALSSPTAGGMDAIGGGPLGGGLAGGAPITRQVRGKRREVVRQG